MTFIAEYLDIAGAVLRRVAETQADALDRAATLVADTIKRDRIIYTLGSGHSLMIAAELYYRAGGMANFDVLHDRTFGRGENLTGYGRTLLESYPVGAGDLVIIVSNSGRNCLTVETALEARERGIPTVAITSLTHSRSVSPRNPSGLRLFEVCDVVIDTGTPLGDACVPVAEGSEARVAPVSTLAGIFAANCVSGMAARKLYDSGFTPPVFLSSNVEGAGERNAHLLEFMRHRIRGL